jgi:serine/threonine-protein kinase RsbT
MGSEVFTMVFEVKKDDFQRAGEASSAIKKTLRHIGINSEIIRRVAIATYESEINIVIHSIGGTITAYIDHKKIRILSKDKGPGIKDVELAMTEGYSTATDEIRELGFGAGMGLPNMKKCSDEFHITSKVGKGTEVEMIINIY